MARFADLVRVSVGSSRLGRWARRLPVGSMLPILFVAIYVLTFPFNFPLLTWYNTPQATFASITHGSYLAAVGLGLSGLALVVLYSKMWAVARDRPGRLTASLILAGWLGASAALLLTYPGHSTDLGDYTFRAHMLVHLGKNPMTVTPHDVIAFEDYPYLAWHDTVDPYGPTWHWLAGSAHALVGESILANLLAFKILAMIMTGISGGLVYGILRWLSPRHAEAGLALWLWNPEVLNEGALHGHNDLVMVVLVLAGLGLVLRGRQTLGVVMLLAAGLVKANIWILAPVVIVWILRQQGWRHALFTVAPALLASALLVWLTYLPFGGWMRLVELARERSWWPASTWTAAAFFALRDGVGWSHELTVKVVISAATVLFGIVALILLAKIRDLITGAWAIVLAYLLIGSHSFTPWYATWLIALTAIVINRRLVAYTTIFTYFLLLQPIVARYLASQLVLPPGGQDMVMAATTLLVPQIMALRLITRSSAVAKSQRPASSQA